MKVGRWGPAIAVAFVAAAGLLWLVVRHAVPVGPAASNLDPAESEAPVAATIDAAQPTSRASPPPVEAATGAPAADRARSHVALLRFSVPGSSDVQVAFVSVSPRSRPVPRRPDVPLGVGRLVVAIEDRERRELWRTVIADPRVVRGEFFDDEGRIEESTSVRRDAAASIVYPEHEDAHRLVVLEPERAGARFELSRIAALDLP